VIGVHLCLHRSRSCPGQGLAPSTTGCDSLLCTPECERPNPVCQPTSCAAALLHWIARCAQGPEDVAAFGFSGHYAHHMRTGAGLAALVGPFALLRDFAGVRFKLPKWGAVSPPLALSSFRPYAMSHDP
jgi:hypothetical protein